MYPSILPPKRRFHQNCAVCSEDDLKNLDAELAAMAEESDGEEREEGDEEEEEAPVKEAEAVKEKPKAEKKYRKVS